MSKWVAGYRVGGGGGSVTAEGPEGRLAMYGV